MATIEDFFKDTITEALSALVDGAREDIEQYASAIAADASMIFSEPLGSKRVAMRDELLGQLRALGEVNRIEANNEAWEAFDKILTGVINIGLKAMARAT